MIYKTRGPITDHDEVPYLVRYADTELETLVKQIDYVALIGPRLSGKTSMLMHLWNKLRTLPRYVLTYVNLRLYSTFDEPRWYAEMVSELIHSSGGVLPVSMKRITDAIDFREAIVNVLENELSNRVLIILLDGVETVPQQHRTSFFATLREMFESRGLQAAFQRLSFVLAGSYIANDLIPDPSISPFRVAEKVYIDDATDLMPLLSHLNRPDRPVSSDVPARISEWTEGDVYFTQRLCERLEQRFSSGRITPMDVDQVVERYLFEDDIFAGLENKLKSQPPTLEVINGVVTQQTNIRFNGNHPGIASAWLLGCVKRNRFGNCIVRNSIYEAVLRDMLGRTEIKTPPPFSVPILVEEPKEPEPLNGRYVLEQVLKRGSLNYLYRARDLYTGETVVIKQLLMERGGDVVAWRRFQREGDALRQLSHPNIVRLHETFRSGDYNYIVMEYVAGGTVEQLFQEGRRQPLSLTLEVMLSVADALRHAHAHAIIHRDIKPSNILLTADLSPRVADFGVARFLKESERITVTHAIVGTPAYIAPESYENGSMSPAEDVWSLGVTIYEMLTGTLPFKGHTYDHIRHAIQYDPIPDVRMMRPDVSPLMAQALAQMLERQVSRRLPDGEAVYATLSNVRNELG